MERLKLAGVSSAGVALLHLVIPAVGAPAYRYFGAGERMARMAERGLARPTLITLGLALVFAVWAAYAFSAAGLIRRLPLLRPALLVIGVIYTLRGVLLGPQLVWFIAGPRRQCPSASSVSAPRARPARACGWAPSAARRAG
jgi:hypothetical protein